MRILHFVEGFPKLSETFIRRFIDKSAQFGEAAVVTFHKEGEFKNIKIYELPAQRYNRSKPGQFLKYTYGKLSGQPFWARAFQQIVKDFRPDVIHCHFGKTGVKFLKTLCDVPFVVSFYGYDISLLPKRNLNYAQGLPLLFEKADAFLVEGPALGDKLEAFGVPKQKIILNPLLIPMEEYSQKKVFRRPDDPIRFLFIGRFVEKKGFHLFLEALGECQQLLPDFEVNIIGEGRMEKEYKKIIDKYRMRKHVHFLGLLEHEKVIELLAEHDFFVHPSLTAEDGDSEGGAPTIISEAQAVGIPVITSDHADIPFVMGYHDFLSKEGNIEDLRKKLQAAVIYEHWEKLVEEGRDKIRMQHDLSSSSGYYSAFNAVLK